ncbi:hypothetical protein NDU88_001398 [Pleurodeles waltl]|uniref:Uncharacterized protein n=1 Tax=Pleurodeles waltl TaxID=8319 RepID=A0AAV7SCU9_PLEWA|nr:hypothetical protein NDU88_001398 [Pleurodeles waltl]
MARWRLHSGETRYLCDGAETQGVEPSFWCAATWVNRHELRERFEVTIPAARENLLCDINEASKPMIDWKTFDGGFGDGGSPSGSGLEVGMQMGCELDYKDEESELEEWEIPL